MINKYEIIIYWSDEDQAFIADVPELPGCMAHGNTYESALSNITSAMDLWLDTTKKFDALSVSQAGTIRYKSPYVAFAEGYRAGVEDSYKVH